MAHYTTHRRSLASLEPKPSMDPTHKKHTVSTPKPHPTHHQDPTIPPSSTIQNISNHFSTLYTNHKVLTSLKGHSSGHSHPCIDTHVQEKAMTVSSQLDTSCTTLTKSKSQHVQEKAMTVSSHLDTSCTTLTKSKSQHGRHVKDIHKESTKAKVKEKVVKEAFDVHDIENPSFVKQKRYEIKKPLSKKECINKDFHEEKHDVKKEFALMSRSYEGDEMKRFQEGCEMKRPSFSLAMNGGGRRRSFSSSQTELADFFTCNGVKVVSVDMPPFMQIHAVDCARKTYDSLEKFTAKTLACTLKKEFDGVYGPAWHCIVGTSFGSFVTHSVGGFMYFSMDHKMYILLFKTTVPKAE